MGRAGKGIGSGGRGWGGGIEASDFLRRWDGTMGECESYSLAWREESDIGLWQSGGRSVWYDIGAFVGWSRI